MIADFIHFIDSLPLLKLSTAMVSPWAHWTPLPRCYTRGWEKMTCLDQWSPSILEPQLARLTVTVSCFMHLLTSWKNNTMSHAWTFCFSVLQCLLTPMVLFTIITWFGKMVVHTHTSNHTFLLVSCKHQTCFTRVGSEAESRRSLRSFTRVFFGFQFHKKC